MSNNIEESIKDLIMNKNYSGVVVKTIAVKKNGNWENFFSSFTFANSIFLKVNDAEWRDLSKSLLHRPSNYDSIKQIVEFNAEKNNYLLIRKHIEIDKMFRTLIDIQQHRYFWLDGRKIGVDVEIDSDEIYEIGSHSASIFVNANANLDRMAHVIVGWSKNNRIYALNKVLNMQINNIDVCDPIETLIGFLEYHIPKELCSSICIYVPNYSAWLVRERFYEGKQVEVGICSEKEELIRKLVLLYKINKSNETIIWNSHKFEKAPKFDAKDQYLVFYQPVPKDIDTSLLLLVDNEFTIHDFSSEVPYVKSFICTMDGIGGKRKHRSRIIVDKSKKSQDVITKRKACVASMKRETILFTSGDQYTAVETVKRILDSAINTIAIMDPYFGNDITDWDIFSDIASNIDVKILTSLESRNKVPTHFHSALSQLRIEINNVHAKNIYVNIPTRNRPQCPFHDRYFIIDDKLAWSIGTSINGLGKRDSCIVKIDIDNCKEIVDRFNYYWTSKSPIHKILINNLWTEFVIKGVDI